MADYYIDSLTGIDENDGKSPSSPLPSHTGISLLPGDTVYFRRGSEYHCGIFSPSGEKDKPITFKTYGKVPRRNSSAQRTAPANGFGKKPKRISTV